jgi:hypothetical protein
MPHDPSSIGTYSVAGAQLTAGLFNEVREELSQGISETHLKKSPFPRWADLQKAIHRSESVVEHLETASIKIVALTSLRILAMFLSYTTPSQQLLPSFAFVYPF